VISKTRNYSLYDKSEIMEEEKRRRGRPVTPYKVPLMVRVTPEAAEILKRQPNQSEFIDRLIKKSVPEF